jgi:20S proteasome alpha/beta subunit
MVLTSENGISNTDLKSNIWLATLIISEIKTFDKYSSGNTHIATIDKYGYKEYSRKEIVETYESKREELVTLAHSLGVEKEVARSTHPMHPDP